jgi:hypothetical protein
VDKRDREITPDLLLSELHAVTLDRDRHVLTSDCLHRCPLGWLNRSPHSPATSTPAAPRLLGPILGGVSPKTLDLAVPHLQDMNEPDLTVIPLNHVPWPPEDA